MLLAGLAHRLWPSDATSAAIDQPPTTGWQQNGAANPFGPGKPATAEQRTLAQAGAQALPSLAHTSLAGTQPDGDWGMAAQGRLVPSRALRQRFDYYLSLIGELSLADLRALVLQDAQQNLQQPALGQAMTLWDQYVQLQQHAWKHAVDLRQPSTWSAALVERQIMRRQLLGANVAHAFYADEESALQSMLGRVNSGALAGQAAAFEAGQAHSSPQAVAVHPQAQEREAQLQAQWQAWEARLDAARSQVQAYNQAPELSVPQRRQAIETYLSQQFQGAELSRARSLLGL
jgi:lipase chaperone LimK